MATFTNDELYAPCFCGSGKKLKFCCKDKRSRTATSGELARLDKAIDALDDGNIAAARPALEKLLADGLGIIEVRMGLVAAMVSAGEYDDAIAASRIARGIPGEGRDAAGATLAHLLALRGDVDDANRLVDEILGRASDEPIVVMALLSALNALERDIDIVAVCKGPVLSAVPLAAHAVAVAHINLGERAKGLQQLRAADWSEPDVKGLIALLSSSAAASSWPWPRFEAVPLDLFLPSGGGSPYAEHAAMGRLVDDEAGSRLIARGLRGGLLVNDQPRYVDGILGFLAALHPTVALSTLRDVWESSWSTDAVRVRAARLAVAFGLLPDGGAVSMLVDGERQQVIVHRAEPRVAELNAILGLTDVDERALSQARFLLRAGRSKPALAAFQALLEQHPDSVALQHQVHSQKLMQREISDDTFIAETTALLTRAPRFLEGRQALARLLDVIDRADEAHAILNDSHVADAADDETACFAHMVLARLALRGDDTAAVTRHVQAAEQWLGRDLLRFIEPEATRAVYGDDGA